MSEKHVSDERKQLEAAIDAQEQLRGKVDDAIINKTITSLREKIAGLKVTEQRKLASLLFMDIAEHTKLFGDLDPEDNMAIIDKALQLLAEPIESFGGHITRFQGDGFKAVFGLPISHEQDADNAIRAGLAILSIADEIAKEIEKNWDKAGFQVRVGIDSGLVFSGGETEGEDTIKGSPVNLAARLESAADPGTLLISQHTYALVRGGFELENLKPIKPKGFDEEVAIFRVLGEKEHSFHSKRRGVEGIETPMVGRQAELDLIKETLETVASERSLQSITVMGDAGLGKTRLLMEFEDWLKIHPGTRNAFYGRARAETRQLPYDLLRSIFAFQFGLHADDNPELTREKFTLGYQQMLGQSPASEAAAHVLGQLLGYAFSDSPHLKSIGQDGQLLYERGIVYLKDFFHAASTTATTVLLLEDLHWADHSSLAALQEVLSSLVGQPFLTLSAARPELVERYPAWMINQELHQYINLAPLNSQESQALVGKLLQKAEQIPGALRETITKHAEGNPFYLEELIKVLVEEGVIVRTEPQWQIDLQRLNQIKVPATLTGVLQARLDRLPSQEKALIQQASVMGRVFWDQALAFMNHNGIESSESKEIQDDLANLDRREMIFEQEHSSFLEAREYLFKHTLLRDVTYEGLIKKLRRKYHRLAAEWLRSQHENQAGALEGVLAGQIGWHYTEANEIEKATPYLIEAGDHAFLVSAFQEALNAYHRAIEHLKQSEQHDLAARTLMKIGSVQHLEFQFEKANLAFRQAFDYWQKAALQETKEALPLAPHAFRYNMAIPRALDPISIGTDGAALVLLSQIYSGLFEIRSSDEGVIPEMARSWEISDDGLQYTIQLHDNFTWSDGAPVVADDFIAYFKERNRWDKEHGGPGFLFLVTAPTDHTLVFDLDQADPRFLLDAGHFIPLPRHAIEKFGKEAWSKPENLVTNGPFILAEYAPGDRITLMRNPNYRGRFNGNLERVELVDELMDVNKLIQLYDADQLDLLFMMMTSFPSLKELHRRYSGEILVYPIAMTGQLEFSNQPPFDDVRVRQAFAHAANQDALVIEGVRWMAQPATGGGIHPNVPGHSSDTGLSYNPELAQTLLQEAGYPGGKGFPTVEMWIYAGGEFVSEHLSAQWEKTLGVQINWKHPPWKEYVIQVSENPPSANFIAQGGANNPLTYILTDERVVGTHENYMTLLNRARQAEQADEQVALIRELDSLQSQEAFIIPLLYSDLPRLVKPWVEKLYLGWYLSLKDAVLHPH